ncbi:hypothetical protein Patl1_18512 [Pistacia atlantica]|uniref:Uncharacterized protein n=1 Tax=Pistacia atlantica TaxID=434234 RepID=A0ACC1BZ26_9ROSI|nr:hypothetical protein Patl1_18512 [Pistacia atlantica]
MGGGSFSCQVLSAILGCPPEMWWDIINTTKDRGLNEGASLVRFCPLSQDASRGVTYDGRLLIINGKKELLLSGSVHYPRMPPEMWWDIINKAKDGGLNVIQTCVFWSLHEPVQGQYNFEGNCNLTEAKKPYSAGLLETMEELVAFIPREGSQKLALEDKSKNSAENAKRPAPKAGGCRIEGYVRVKKGNSNAAILKWHLFKLSSTVQVPGNLIISARPGAHSFDICQMNISHVITHLSFGRILSPKVMSDVWLIELL